MAAEQGAETATEAAQTGDQQEETPTAARPQAGTKTEYSTCLVRTHRSLLLDVESTRFTPWPDYGDNRSVWDVIRYRHVDYISDYCEKQAPVPPATYSSTCIPREIQSFYRRHIPEGSDSATSGPLPPSTPSPSASQRPTGNSGSRLRRWTGGKGPTATSGSRVWTVARNGSSSTGPPPHSGSTWQRGSSPGTGFFPGWTAP